MKFLTITCCPVPDQMYPILLSLQKKIPGLTYNSVYRGEDRNAAQYLTGSAPCFKHTQAWIYANYPPGVANPPGRSTHELRNDGVAYAGWAGMPLAWYQVGIDINDQFVDAFIQEAAKAGWLVTRTYPASAVEYHHVNFRRMPTIRQSWTIKWADKGPLVYMLTYRLMKIGLLPRQYWHFNQPVHGAVVRFQKENHLTADGIVGIHTWTKLAVEFRKKKKKK